MKIKEIKASKGGVIPIASFSNLRIGFEISAEIGEDEDASSIFKKLQEIIDEQFEREEQNAAVKRIEKLYKNIRFYKKNGKKYPSVTSVMDWDTTWKIPSYELNQYGARGTIIHKISELFLLEGKWYEPEDIPELEKDINIVLSGNLKLHWEKCSHKKFFGKYRKDIEIEAVEEVVFNESLNFAGRLDLRGKFQGLRSIMDNKTGGYKMMQLAAYSSCVEGNERLVVFPIGPTDNVSGYNRPVICEKEGIELNFKRFLEKRKNFRENFGI